jgi:hypothetical protein
MKKPKPFSKIILRVENQEDLEKLCEVMEMDIKAKKTIWFSHDPFEIGTKNNPNESKNYE